LELDFEEEDEDDELAADEEEEVAGVAVGFESVFGVSVLVAGLSEPAEAGAVLDEPERLSVR
jgi:hypothetical protein